MSREGMDSNLFYACCPVQPTADSWDKVMFEVTNHCNLNCPFCLNESSAENDVFLSFEDFKIMIDKIKPYVNYVQLSGGETLSNPDILRMLDYLIENDFGFSVNTNGMLISDELIDLLVSYDKAILQMSLDGVNAETDDYFRCKGHFDKVVTVMKLLNEKNFKKGVIKMVINRRNFDQIEDYFELAMQYNFVPTYGMLLLSGRAKNNWSDLSITDAMRCESRNRICKLLDKHADYFKKYTNGNYLLEYYKKTNIDYVSECTFNLKYFNFSPLILPDGSAQPCQRLFQKEFTIGNLITQSPEEIYSQENVLVKMFADRVKQRRQKLDEALCKDCGLNKICGKGCLATSCEAGDFFGKPTECGMRKRDFLQSMLCMGGMEDVLV